MNLIICHIHIFLNLPFYSFYLVFFNFVLWRLDGIDMFVVAYVPTSFLSVKSISMDKTEKLFDPKRKSPKKQWRIRSESRKTQINQNLNLLWAETSTVRAMFVIRHRLMYTNLWIISNLNSWTSMNKQHGRTMFGNQKVARSGTTWKYRKGPTVRIRVPKRTGRKETVLKRAYTRGTVVLRKTRQTKTKYNF